MLVWTGPLALGLGAMASANGAASNQPGQRPRQRNTTPLHEGPRLGGGFRAYHQNAGVPSVRINIFAKRTQLTCPSAYRQEPPAGSLPSRWAVSCF
jgi:hypothetical protein